MDKLNQLSSPAECQCAVSVDKGQPIVTEMYQQHGGTICMMDHITAALSQLSVPLMASYKDHLGASVPWRGGEARMAT